MKVVYFIINHAGNHVSVKEEGGGASEFLFYSIAEKLSHSFNVIVFNRDQPRQIDGIEYRFLPDNGIPELPMQSSGDCLDAIVVVQRHFSTAIDVHKTYPQYKYVLWSHDYLELNPKQQATVFGRYPSNETDSYLAQHNIHVVCVSEFHKRNISSILPNAAVSYIYNGLFPEVFTKESDVAYNRDRIIFCSAWQKGVDRVLEIGSKYRELNSEFELIMITPAYSEVTPWSGAKGGLIDWADYPFVTVMGCIKSKEEYSRLVRGCLAVFSTSFPETFGCAFAEALHLGVPVIGDSSVDAGFREIIPKENMRDFRNHTEVIDLIEGLRTHRPEVRLDDKFYSESVVARWRELLESI